MCAFELMLDLLCGEVSSSSKTHEWSDFPDAMTWLLIEPKLIDGNARPLTAICVKKSANISALVFDSIMFTSLKCGVQGE